MEDWEDWQKTYQYGTIVIWPPDDVREIINQQREEYDPKSSAICEAHITLTQPLLGPLEKPDWEIIEQITSQIQPLEIQYGPLKSFLPYPCIWYEIQPMEQLLEIRAALHMTGFFNLSLPHTEGFIPHMTITEHLSGPEVNLQLLEDLQKESTPGEFTFTEISLIEPDENFFFSVQRVIPLG
jgi:2'-5' RNA ligase